MLSSQEANDGGIRDEVCHPDAGPGPGSPERGYGFHRRAYQEDRHDHRVGGLGKGPDQEGRHADLGLPRLRPWRLRPWLPWRLSWRLRPRVRLPLWPRLRLRLWPRLRLRRLWLWRLRRLRRLWLWRLRRLRRVRRL